MHPTSDVAATLGSRFNLIFDPHDRRLYQSAYGRFRECELQLLMGLKTPDGETYALPFTEEEGEFPFVEQFASLTGLRWRGVHPDLGLDFRADLRAPFYPRNVGISTAPFYYLDLEVRPLGAFRHVEAEHRVERGQIVFALSGEGIESEAVEEGFRYSFQSRSPARSSDISPIEVEVPCWVESGEGESFGSSGIRAGFDLSDGRPARLGLLWSHWQEQPVLEVFEQKTAFKYLELFDSRDEMLAWAAEERQRIERRCDVVDKAVTGWSLGSSASRMTALALHSFLADTWWTTRKSGDWFSVWEGSCYYHSTVDVEYNDAMLYLALWPELLEMLLDQWAEFEVDGTESLGSSGKGTGFLCHDMGSDHVVGRQFYPHHMEVEENVNYLLLLSAWAQFTGKLKEAARKLKLCRRLAEFVVQADTSGNGIPDRGVANTIDDAGAAVQYGREQIYLAVKSQAALWALAELEQRCGVKDSKAERWRAFASKGIKTMEEQAWLGDHYAVTLDQTTEGLVDPWTGEDLPEGELTGWDAYSIYTANGLLYLFLSGMKTPRWKMNRFANDIENVNAATMTAYGCRHSSAGGGTVWFSQNMWRDYVAAYLGVDLLNNVERYWDYQSVTGHNWRSSLYYDTTEGNDLNFYPRGATVFGMPLSAAGLSLNRDDGTLTLQPVRDTLSVPLLPLADWEKMRIPELTVRHREGVAVARITDRELLEGLKVKVHGAELEPQ